MEQDSSIRDEKSTKQKISQEPSDIQDTEPNLVLVFTGRGYAACAYHLGLCLQLMEQGMMHRVHSIWAESTSCVLATLLHMHWKAITRQSRLIVNKTLQLDLFRTSVRSVLHQFCKQQITGDDFLPPQARTHADIWSKSSFYKEKPIDHDSFALHVLSPMLRMLLVIAPNALQGWIHSSSLFDLVARDLSTPHPMPRSGKETPRQSRRRATVGQIHLSESVWQGEIQQKPTESAKPPVDQDKEKKKGEQDKGQEKKGEQDKGQDKKLQDKRGAEAIRRPRLNMYGRLGRETSDISVHRPLRVKQHTFAQVLATILLEEEHIFDHDTDSIDGSPRVSLRMHIKKGVSERYASLWDGVLRTCQHLTHVNQLVISLASSTHGGHHVQRIKHHLDPYAVLSLSDMVDACNRQSICLDIHLVRMGLALPRPLSTVTSLPPDRETKDLIHPLAIVPSSSPSLDTRSIATTARSTDSLSPPMSPSLVVTTSSTMTILPSMMPPPESPSLPTRYRSLVMEMGTSSQHSCRSFTTVEGSRTNWSASTHKRIEGLMDTRQTTNHLSFAEMGVCLNWGYRQMYRHLVHVHKNLARMKFPVRLRESIFSFSTKPLKSTRWTTFCAWLRECCCCCSCSCSSSSLVTQDD